MNIYMYENMNVAHQHPFGWKFHVQKFLFLSNWVYLHRLTGFVVEQIFFVTMFSGLFL